MGEGKFDGQEIGLSERTIILTLNLDLRKAYNPNL